MNVTDLIKTHEALDLRMYPCTSGKLTIGWGRNIEDNGIRLDEAELMLSNDIRDCRVQLTKEYSWFNSLDEVRQAAVLDLCFNLGITRLRKFVKFATAMARSDWQRAGDELVSSAWYGQVKSRGPRVVLMIRTGGWPP
jgi:lysozyme